MKKVRTRKELIEDAIYLQKEAIIANELNRDIHERIEAPNRALQLDQDNMAIEEGETKLKILKDLLKAEK